MTRKDSFELLGNTIYVDTILEKPTFTQNDVIFLSGSLISGLGNKYSDLDIFVLLDSSIDSIVGKFEYEFGNTKIEYALLEEIRCDIEYWELDKLLQVIKEINAADLDDESIKVVNILESARLSEISFILHRLLTGVCIYNQDRFDHIVRNFNTDKFFRIMVRYYINLVDNAFEDIMGNIDTERYHAAVMIGREILPTILMAYLYSKKISVIRTKWVYPILEECARKDGQAEKILSKFTKIYFSTLLDTKKRMLTNARRILLFINYVITEIEKNLGGL